MIQLMLVFAFSFLWEFANKPKRLHLLSNLCSRRGTKPEEQSEESEDDKIEGRISAEADGDTAEKKMYSDDHSCERVCLEDDNVGKSDKKDDAMDVDLIQDAGSDDEDYAYSGKGDVDDSDFSDSGNSKRGRNSKQTGRVVAPRHFGVRWSTRLAGGAGQPFAEIESLGTKKRMRQRPILNSSLDCIIVPDSEDDS